MYFGVVIVSPVTQRASSSLPRLVSVASAIRFLQILCYDNIFESVLPVKEGRVLRGPYPMLPMPDPDVLGEGKQPYRSVPSHRPDPGSLDPPEELS